MFIAAWTQFGRLSGLAVDSSDILYVGDSQLDDKINPVSKPGSHDIRKYIKK